VDELHAAIAAHLRTQRPYRPSLPPAARVFCRACGRRILVGEGRFALALLYQVRRCADCYTREHPEEG
jgi:hypothetical protein